MEFYGSEATILTKAKPRSILLLKIHKTHIVQHHKSIFAIIYMSNVYVQAHWSMDKYIASFSIIDYYHPLFYSLGPMIQYYVDWYVGIVSIGVALHCKIIMTDK